MSDEKELIGRAGEGDVEEAEFLVQGFDTFLLACDPEGERWVMLFETGRFDLAGESELGIGAEDDPLGGVGEIEGSRQTREEDDGELEAFTGVDGDESDGILG